MRQWYKVTVHRGHVGTSRSDDVIAYVFANNIDGVLRRYRIMPGVKKRNGKHFPNISILSLEAAVELEQDISNEGRITLEKAKKTWYYSGEM